MTTVQSTLLTGTALIPPVQCGRCGGYHGDSCPSFLEPVQMSTSYDPVKVIGAIAQKPPSDDFAGWGSWLEGVQAAMGITYERDDEAIDAELRATFAQMVAAIPGAISEDEPRIDYTGYRSRPGSDGHGEVRTSIRRLWSTITLPNGNKFIVHLEGPFQGKETTP